MDCLAEVRSSQTPRNLFGVDRFSRCVALRPGPDLAAEFPALEALQFDATRLRIGPTEDAGAMFIEERLATYRRTYVLETLKDEPRLRAYRDFFWRVGVDPTKVRPAAEALLRRVIQGSPFPGSTRSSTPTTSRPPRCGSRWRHSIRRSSGEIYGCDAPGSAKSSSESACRHLSRSRAWWSSARTRTVSVRSMRTSSLMRAWGT